MLRYRHPLRKYLEVIIKKVKLVDYNLLKKDFTRSHFFMKYLNGINDFLGVKHSIYFALSKRYNLPNPVMKVGKVEPRLFKLSYFEFPVGSN